MDDTRPDDHCRKVNDYPGGFSYCGIHVAEYGLGTVMERGDIEHVAVAKRVKCDVDNKRACGKREEQS